MKNPLLQLAARTCFSLTGADPVVLKACMRYMHRKNDYFLCEASVNQVNQYGGYTGMKPVDYAAMVCAMAREIGFPVEKIILCGDHLGPFAWQNRPAKEAMEESRELVREMVGAGFRKIHLDPTMPLADDDKAAFGDRLIAQRIADLARVSEETYQATSGDTPWSFRPAYVVGSEVPVPGGSAHTEKMVVTKPDELRQSISCIRQALIDQGLGCVWENTVAVVAQIGLEFSEDHVYDFDADKADALYHELLQHRPLVFESHSSDYQTPEKLQQMVNKGVGILKVGPETTYAHREALFALSYIEDILADVWGFEASHYRAVLDKFMLDAKPNYWANYYHGTEAERAMKRAYSYSDRCRYYVVRPEAVAAERKLIANLSQKPIPMYLISQFLPVQYERIREGKLAAHPQAMIDDKIQAVMARYYENMLRAKQSLPD